MITRGNLLCLLVMFGAASHLTRGAETNEQSGVAKAIAPKSFQIRNLKYGNLLRPEEANGANGTPIVLYPAQLWKCMTWKFYSAGESRYQLQNHFTSKTFASTAGETAPGAVKQVPFSKKADERPNWELTRLSDGSYKIVEAKSGKALTAIKEGSSFEAHIVVQNWHDGEEQKWELKEIDPKDLTM